MLYSNQIRKKKLSLPNWYPFFKKFQGVFVGTEICIDAKCINCDTNCSTGLYENKSFLSLSTSTAEKIRIASKNCHADALTRWTKPYRKSLLDKMSYKLVLLNPENTWKEYKASDVFEQFEMNGKYGILLKLSSGRSAIYLPSVANMFSNTEEYMNSLSKKAKGNKNDWRKKNSTIRIYTTQVFKWTPCGYRKND